MAGAPSRPRVLGRYALYDEIASGGMATVHFGRLLGQAGFARTVAIKRLHAQFARDPEFVSNFVDEARLATRIQHPNVVPTLDVVALAGELFLVMEYVRGVPLGSLINACHKQGKAVPPAYAVAIVAGALRGLHAAHEAKDERGNALEIVHRDVSPQNVLVGVDGVARVLDFGIAKAAGRLQVSRQGEIKGKLAYMSPEQVYSKGTDRRTDIYASGAILWETLTGQRLFKGDNDVAVLAKVLVRTVSPPSGLATGVPPELDAIVARALAPSPDERFQTAKEMARALEAALPLVPPAEIGEWVETIGADQLEARNKTVARIEADPTPSYYREDSTAEAKPPRPASIRPPRQPIPYEQSVRSIVTFAFAPRFDRRRVAMVASGGLVLVMVIAALVRVATGGGAAPDEALVTTTPADPSTPPPPPSASPPWLPVASAPPAPSSSPASSPHVAPSPGDTSRPRTPGSGPPRHRPLDNLLNSRK